MRRGQRLYLWTLIAGNFAAAEAFKDTGPIQILHQWLKSDGGTTWKDYRKLSAGVIHNSEGLRWEASSQGKDYFDWRAPTDLQCPEKGLYRVAVAIYYKKSKTLQKLVQFDVEVVN